MENKFIKGWYNIFYGKILEIGFLRNLNKKIGEDNEKIKNIYIFKRI